MADPITVEGFVILPPLSPWDKKHAAEIWGHLSPGTFGRTAGEAWARKIQLTGDNGEDAMRRQRSIDAGYRLARATMMILPDGEPE